MATSKKVFDVAKPGNSSPDATSRPIIVGQKLQVEDATITKPAANQSTKQVAVRIGEPSMVAEENATEETAAPQATLSTSARKTIQPLSHDQPVDEVSSAATSEVPAEPEPATEESESAEDEPTDSSDAAVLDAVADQAGGNRKNIEEAEAAAKKEAIEKLIESKQYYLPIDESKHVRGFERVMIGLLLVLLLALIGFDLAIDAGLIKTDIQPFVDLIHNEGS